MVQPAPGESDADALARELARHPQGKADRKLIAEGVKFPMINLRLGHGPVNLPPEEDGS